MPKFLAPPVVPASTWANRGSGTAGGLMRITDRSAGVFEHNGTDYVSVNGGWLNVLDRGLRNDNSTDNAAALQAINDDAGITSPVALWFPPGTYRFRSAVRITNTKICGLCGPGHGLTFLVLDPATDTTSGLLRVNVLGDTGYASGGLNNMVISGLHLGAITSDRTAGACLYLGKVTKSIVTGVKVSNSLGTRPYVGVVVEESNSLVFQALSVEGCASDGIQVANPSGGTGTIIEVFFQSGCFCNSNLGNGMLIQHTGTYANGSSSTEGIHLDAMSFYGNAGDAIRIATASSASKVSNVHLQGAILDTSTGNGLYYTGAGQLRSLIMEDCWASYNGLCGVDLDAATASGAVNFAIVGGNYSLNVRDGVRVSNANQGRIQAAGLFNNSRSSTGAYSAIALAGATQQVLVSDCRAYNSYTDTGNYGVQNQDGVSVGASTLDCRVQGCFLDTTNYGSMATVPLSVASGATRFTAGGNQVTWNQSPDPHVDATQFGATGDLSSFADGAYGSSGTHLTSATAAFEANDVGKTIVINGAATATAVTGAVTTTSGAATLTVVGAAFTASDVGKWIMVPGSGAAGGTLTTTIASLTGPTSVTLAANAGTTQAAVSQAVKYAGWLTTTIAARNSATDVTLAGTISNASLASAPFAFGTDNGPAIQSAIDAQATAARVFLPAGNYLVGTAVTINGKQVSLVGTGHAETQVYLANNVHFLSVNVAQAAKTYSMTFGEMTVLALADQSAGSALRLGNVGQCNVSNLKVANSGGGRVYQGIVFHQATQVFVRQLRATGCASHGILFDPDAAGSLVGDIWLLDDFQSDGNLSDGIRLQNRFANTGPAGENLQGIYIGAGSVYNNYASGVHFVVANAVKKIFFRGTIVDSNRSIGFFVDSSGSATVKYLRMENAWISYNGNPTLINSAGAAASDHNCYIDSVVTDFLISNCYILLGGKTGLTLNNAARGKVQGCIVSDNSQSGTGYAGITLSGTNAKIQIQGNRVYNTFGALTNKQFGLTVANSPSDLDISNNFFDTNLGGSGTIARNISATATNVREWGNTYDTSTGNVVAFYDDGLAATTSDVVQVGNTTASTSGVPVQVSPSIRFTGHAWNTTATAADNYVEARECLVPASAATPTAKLSWQFGTPATAANSTFTERMSASSAGMLALGTAGTAGAGVTVAGSTSGTTVVQATAAASGTLTLPAATDTLVGKATTDTLTNKTLTSPTLTTPAIGVATGTSLAATGLITSSGTAGVGYATGAGGTVTQATSRSTGVTLSKICGQITTNTTSLAAGAEAEFTVTNTTVAATDNVVVTLASGNTGVGTCFPFCSGVAAGSFKITVSNLHASTAETGACVLNFAVIKGVSA